MNRKATTSKFAFRLIPSKTLIGIYLQPLKTLFNASTNLSFQTNFYNPGYAFSYTTQQRGNQCSKGLRRDLTFMFNGQ